MINEEISSNSVINTRGEIDKNRLDEFNYILPDGRIFRSKTIEHKEKDN